MSHTHGTNSSIISHATAGLFVTRKKCADRTVFFPMFETHVHARPTGLLLSFLERTHAHTRNPKGMSNAERLCRRLSRETKRFNPNVPTQAFTAPTPASNLERLFLQPIQYDFSPAGQILLKRPAQSIASMPETKRPSTGILRCNCRFSRIRILAPALSAAHCRCPNLGRKNSQIRKVWPRNFPLLLSPTK
jgi:hypothetical protein